MLSCTDDALSNPGLWCRPIKLNCNHSVDLKKSFHCCLEVGKEIHRQWFESWSRLLLVYLHWCFKKNGSGSKFFSALSYFFHCHDILCGSNWCSTIYSSRFAVGCFGCFQANTAARNTSISPWRLKFILSPNKWFSYNYNWHNAIDSVSANFILLSPVGNCCRLFVSDSVGTMSERTSLLPTIRYQAKNLTEVSWR